MSDMVKKIVRYGAILLGVILIGVFAFRFLGAFNSFQTGMSEADLRIANYQKEILSENAKLEAAAKTAKDSRAGVYNMKDPGSAVAVLQTKMSILPSSIVNAKQENLQAQQDALYSAQKSLAEYFSDGESSVWYPAETTSTGKVVWKCITTYDTRQTDLPCVWVCYWGSNDTKLLAYAIAKYDVNTTLFSDVQVFITDSGMEDMLQQEVD